MDLSSGKKPFINMYISIVCTLMNEKFTCTVPFFDSAGCGHVKCILIVYQMSVHFRDLSFVPFHMSLNCNSDQLAVPFSNQKNYFHVGLLRPVSKVYSCHIQTS